MKVIHTQFGEGTIVSQDANNVTINFNGVEKTLITRFARLMNEDGTPFGQHATLVPVTKKSKGEKKRQRDAKELAAFAQLSNVDKLASAIMAINGKVQGDRNGLGYQLISERLSGIYIVAKEKGNNTIMAIIASIEKYMHASDKQAYAVAKFADDNNITY